MQDVPTNRRRAHLALAAAGAALAAAATLLRRFPPSASSFYPSCLFHQLTGLLCPGCGATRALAALAQGHLAEALHANPLVILALPCTAAYFLVVYLRTLRGSPHPWPAVPSRAIAVALALAAIFTVWRNLA